MVEQFRPMPPQESPTQESPTQKTPAAEQVKKIYEDPLITEARRKHTTREQKQNMSHESTPTDVMQQPEVQEALAQRKLQATESPTIEGVNKTLNDPLIQEALRKKRNQN